MAISNGKRTVLFTLAIKGGKGGLAKMLDTATAQTVELPLSAAMEYLDLLLASGYTVAG